MHTPTLRARRGFTIAEMLLSMTLMLALLGLSTQLFRKQSNAVSTQAGRLDAQQNSRFALSVLDRELRMAGVGVLDAQPLLVQAAPLAITFNSDLVAQDTGDVNAVYINPDADSAAVDVMKSSAKITLPTSTTQYPDSTYFQLGGAPSLAETISFWLSRDSTSTRSNEYILFRRANSRPAKVVARGIIYNPGDVVFEYKKPDTLGNMVPIPVASLPLVHNARVHGAQNDTGKSAMTDSIRQVKVTLTSNYHDPKTNMDILRTLTITIKLMNAGLIHHTTCGNPPMGTAPTAIVTAANGTTIPQTFVTLSWPRSGDEIASEKDVERYAVYRRLSTVPTFDQPFASVPSGLVAPATSYTFKDTDVLPDQVWIYGVAAQDCTPLSSSIGQTAPITIPSVP